MWHLVYGLVKQVNGYVVRHWHVIELILVVFAELVVNHDLVDHRVATELCMYLFF